MQARRLTLKHFRNISEIVFDFHPRFNILVGQNAQGKTNIIESLYFLAFGRSFRVSDFRGLIQWSQNEAIVRLHIETPLGEEERSAQLNNEKKRMFKNGKGASPNQFASMPLVLFAPEEILLLKDSPETRRAYIDSLLSKWIPHYSKVLSDYKRALVQRNKLLKEENISIAQKRDQMVFWEKPLLDNGTILIQERTEWVKRLNRSITAYYNTIVGTEQKKAEFVYKPNVTPEDFATLQEERREEELERASTLVGPHRDDFKGVLNGDPIVAFGSQGEMRTFTLAMKLSEIQFFQEVLGRDPIFLLDDVVSELDENRSAFFFSFLKKYKGQIFATATSPTLFPKGVLDSFSAWHMEKGCSKPFTF